MKCITEIDFTQLLKDEFNLTPDNYVAETEGGTIFKCDELHSVGQNVVFAASSIITRGSETPLATEDSKQSYYAGFIKKCSKVSNVWNENTSLDDIMLSLQGNPIPISLIAALTWCCLRA